MIDFLTGSDSVGGVSFISDYELNRATNYGVPDVNVARPGGQDGRGRKSNPFIIVRPLIPFQSAAA